MTATELLCRVYGHDWAPWQRVFPGDQGGLIIRCCRRCGKGDEAETWPPSETYGGC